MAKNFRNLLAGMSAPSRQRAEMKAEKMLGEMALDELRAARDLTQEHLAELLGVKQSAVSKMERRADMHISTLEKFVRAMGGRLEIRVVFQEGSVRIDQFHHLRKASS